jgi:lipoprotein-releasing system permease protein
MNLAYFIAKRINNSKNEDKKVSKPIIRISKISIVLSIVVNIITIAVVTGFQNQIKEKVTGFGAHAMVLRAGEQSAFETAPIVRDTALYNKIKRTPGVKNIQEFAYKPAMLQSSPDTVYYSSVQLDTFQVQQEIQGIVVKGVGSDFNWDFFQQHLVAGNIPDFHPDTISSEILISQNIARDLNLSLGDRVSTFFVKTNPIKDFYHIAGIFETGLEEFDRQVVLGDIRKVQDLNDWGVQARIRIADTVTSEGHLVIYADVTGGNGNYRYDWGEGFTNDRGFTYCDTKDTVIRLIASDYWMFVDEENEGNSIPDTSYLEIKVSGNKTLPCFPKNTFENRILFDYLNDDGTHFGVALKGGKNYTFKLRDGKGSAHNYVGGYEIILHELDQLNDLVKVLKKQVIYSQEKLAYDYRLITIEEDQREIFMWLSFLDLNVLIILVLMILVSTINMGSGLLVLIITKTSLIGLLKALGATNWTIRKIFLHQASLIILKAMLWGNIIGVGLCYLQLNFTLIPLNPEIYYLNAVPIELNFMHILLLNADTLVLCVSALIIPSWVVTKIAPIKAIKFN